AACHHSPAAVPPPVLPAQQLSPPVLTETRSLSPVDSVNDPLISIDTHGSEVDIRTVLDYIGSMGNFKLVYGQGVARKVRVHLTNVPVSVALQAVLSSASLTLEHATQDARAPGANAVVFYQLPVNVDSLSIEAIMKRFGVGRTVAELIVQARTVRP